MTARTHTTAQGCTVRVRAVGESVEIVITQAAEHRAWCAAKLLSGTCGCGAGRSATYACSHDDAVAIGTMIVSAAPRPSEEGDET